MLRLSPHHHSQNRNTRSITEPSELEYFKQKVAVLAQSESLPVDVNAIHKKQSIRKSRRIASFRRSSVQVI